MMQVGRDVKKKGHDWKEMCAVLLIVYSASMMVSKLVFYAQSCMMEVCNEHVGKQLAGNASFPGAATSIVFVVTGFVATSIILS